MQVWCIGEINRWIKQRTRTVVYQISSKSDYFSLRYGHLTIFKMKTAIIQKGYKNRDFRPIYRSRKRYKIGSYSYNSYAIYQMVPFPTTMSDSYQISRTYHYSTLNISKTVQDRDIRVLPQNANRRLYAVSWTVTTSMTLSILNLDFKVTTFMKNSLFFLFNRWRLCTPCS